MLSAVPPRPSVVVLLLNGPLLATLRPWAPSVDVVNDPTCHGLPRLHVESSQCLVRITSALHQPAQAATSGLYVVKAT